MDYEALVAKQKENSKIYNECIIDMQAFANLAPKVINQSAQETEEYTKARDYLVKLCEQIGFATTKIREVFLSNS